MGEMTDKEYLDESGNLCPYCRSVNLENCGAPEIETGTCYQQVECYDCGRMWDDVYEFKGWKAQGDGAT